MKHNSRLLASLALILFIGCTKQEPILHVYNWAEYTKPELIQQFEKEHHCKVVVDTYNANEELYAKLKAGATGYDLIFPTSYMVTLMTRENMLLPLDHAKLPNLAHIDTSLNYLTADPAHTYSVPYMMSCTALAVNKTKVSPLPDSWTVFDRTDLAGRMTMLDDMRETIGAALKTLGFHLNSVNPAELAAARDLVIRWKKNLAKFENEQYKNGIASGEFLVVQGYSGDLVQVIEEKTDIAFVIPKEGTVISCDEMAIPKGAREIDLAHAYINFMHDPTVAAANTEFLYYLCPNKESYSLLAPEVRANPAITIPPAALKVSEIIQDLGTNNALYTAIWDEIKAAQ